MTLSADGITVSVCMITYNHEAYIAEAIEGVLMQKTDYPVELVIGEDCSTDKTRAIVQDYAALYPGRIHPLLNEHNLGAQRNFAGTLEACHGKYVALCEGDDYWTDPLKLQKQVDFLENHPDCSICFHPARIYKTEDHTFLERKPYTKTISTIEDLIDQNFIQTCTATFRNNLIEQIPEWFLQIAFGDWALHIFNAEHGNIGFINETMAVYRSHQGGIWSSRNTMNKLKTGIDFYKILNDYFRGKYSRLIKRGLSRAYVYLASVYADQNDFANAKIYLGKSFQTGFLFETEWIDQIVLLGRLYFPQFYKFSKRLQRKIKAFSSKAAEYQA